MSTIGEKETFWQLINGKDAKNILIPEIQRDYTYGSQTQQTNKVLNNMLNTIERTLYNNGEPEMTLNFVYGFTEEEINYVPLDGQQRLTTLYLLHYYAALYNETADFNVLQKFTYATRETTKNYCNELINNHTDIVGSLESFKGIDDAISDMAWYLPSFKNDPSIRSMQFVLKQIEAKFKVHKEDLWDKLTSDECRVNFYKLDFGTFGLSDDLYVKMNSRGKKLTEYEIFKSMLLKHIEIGLGEKKYKRDLAIKFDNQWTDLVWEAIGKPMEEDRLADIDKAYIYLVLLLFRILSIKQNKMDTPVSLSPESICNFLGHTEDVKYIENFLDVFDWVKTQYTSISDGVDLLTKDLQQIIKEKNPFETCLKEGDGKIKYGDLLMLVGQYWAFKNIKENVYTEERACLNYRHLRNIVENSDDEIRKENMPKLISEVEDVMCGKMIGGVKVEFNTTQWNEECEKENHLTEWKDVWKYEEHSLLRGALSNFADKQLLNMSDITSVANLKNRLEKFMYIFDKDYTEIERDRYVRAAFLCEKDYSQIYKDNKEYRILGNLPLCWRRMLVKSNLRNCQEKVMEVIDSYKVNTTSIEEVLHKRIDNYLLDPTTDKMDWRYYVVKYNEHTYKAYTHTDGYGYFWVPEGHKDELGNKNTLEVAVLQSTQFGSSNVAWYLLNLIVKERNEGKYNMRLGTHAAREDELYVVLSSKNNNIALSIDQKGWMIKGLSFTEAQELGLKNIVEKTDRDYVYLLAQPDKGTDYVEWCEKYILQPLEALPNFKKVS